MASAFFIFSSSPAICPLAICNKSSYWYFSASFSRYSLAYSGTHGSENAFERPEVSVLFPVDSGPITTTFLISVMSFCRFYPSDQAHHGQDREKQELEGR